MDGDSVEESPSQPPSRTPFTDAFVLWFPYYLSIGMTCEQYWQGHSWLTKSYREAFEIKRGYDNWKMWQQGAYIYDAMLRVAPVMRAFGKGRVEPKKYPEEPYPLTEKEANEREEKKRKANYEKMLARLNAESEVKEARDDGNRES